MRKGRAKFLRFAFPEIISSLYSEALILKLNFEAVKIAGLVLAKVGNPSRDEPLQTSKTLFVIEDEDQTTLCPIFLKPFRNLTGQRFTHHSSLDKNEVNIGAKAIFDDPKALLTQGCEIA
jgi:hypothetical protein